MKFPILAGLVFALSAFAADLRIEPSKLLDMTHSFDKKQYMGTDQPGDVANLHFPGIAPDTAKLLLERKPRAVAIDTASIDYGQSKDFLVHRTLFAAGIYGIENVDNAGRLPATGATIIALPMKIKGGTGGPCRIIAILP